MTKAYYNEIDKFAAAWLRELISRDLIAPGEVDERSIEDVTPNDLRGFAQCHFFAGVGVWSYALRQAGWPDNRHVWTGSCPCQPFSTAGKGDGFDDDRHLWPAWSWLIGQCKPDAIFGEQVASKDARAWLDVVSTDLEKQNYAIGSAATVACGFGTPHKRQRIYFVAKNELGNSKSSGRGVFHAENKRKADVQSAAPPNTSNRALDKQRPIPAKRQNGNSFSYQVPINAMANTECGRPQRRLSRGENPQRETIDGSAGCDGTIGRPMETNGIWRDTDWLYCRDGKWRPVEPGTFPLVDGAANRVGRLRGYGNAIVAPQAIAFIKSFLDI